MTGEEAARRELLAEIANPSNQMTPLVTKCQSSIQS